MMAPERVQQITLLLLALAIGIGIVMTPLSMRLAKRFGFIDTPDDDRRMHTKPVPCFGGFAIIIAFAASILICEKLVLARFHWPFDAPASIDKLNAALIGGIVMFVIGAVDDRRNLRWRVKLGGQAASAVIAFALGVRIPAFTVLGWHFDTDSPVSFILTVLWIVAITNMINLIDGLDGLAAGVSGIAALAIGYSAYINGLYVVTFSMIILAGAALGFLPFNFHPARSFMGDGGAMFLGFMLAGISIIGPAKGATIMAVIAPVLVLGVPVFDVAFAMFRRAVKGRPIFAPDKGHLHHQLARIGIGQRRSVLMLYGISGIMGIAAIVFTRDLYLEAAGLFLIAVVFILVLIWGWNKPKN
ncbi:MAG: undecaprenyl/decaprenyl-phosphate alpha-N-acetylglucosaminyl 1-phosphate transferase [Clostridiales Family XIII bacterium]|jgi:UDP-GlcNAc:undecaprenyl-phosphate GlcNAc-1-phosphate transferase|nr:undecaprenyl/decaprenyl-phosphate alpha-N-acetylglucosaminyl 1-phosphate transferase [Clostridiales Family XIII bacterium]